jgi:hypothetical protein
LVAAWRQADNPRQLRNEYDAALADPKIDITIL